MKQYFVYIVECIDSTFYIGITRDLNRRIKQHNGILKGGARYTRIKRPVVLRYYEKVSNRSTALKREYLLKQYTRQKKAYICDRFSCLYKLK